MTLGGVICLKDADKLDYCFRESILSILPVCDVVCLSVASNDVTTEAQIRDWMTHEPKLRINIYPWKEPIGNEFWYNEWLQYARMHTPTDRVLQMDADEVLDSSGYDEIRELAQRPGRFSVRMRRLNFWRDASHLIPDGFCCSHNVIRIAPQDAYLPSDGYDPKATEVPNIAIDSSCRIFHYGFIRAKTAFFEKERFLQKAYFNTFDPRLERAEKHDGNWMQAPGVTEWIDDLIPFIGEHPPVARRWLRDRGYDI